MANCRNSAQKGVHAYSIKVVSDEVELSGYARLILKTDQENAIRALMKAVKNERSENIHISRELSPVGESKSNG